MNAAPACASGPGVTTNRGSLSVGAMLARRLAQPVRRRAASAATGRRRRAWDSIWVPKLAREAPEGAPAHDLNMLAAPLGTKDTRHGFRIGALPLP
jgi:hypothetical protein